MTDIDTLASLLAETGMEEDVSDIDAVRAYRTALRSTYVSRDGDECGRTYNLVDEDAADALIAALDAEVALRDRMLRDIIERIALTPERWNGWTTEEVLADLRARAEKEAER
jgi:hypothetical protein